MSATPGVSAAGPPMFGALGARTPGLPSFSGATPALQASHRALGATANARGARTPGMAGACRCFVLELAGQVQ